MRNRFDQLGKEIGIATLRALGSTRADEALNAETVHPDLLHEPARGADETHEAARMQLGLLGALTRTPCLLELFSEPPRFGVFRDCLTKYLTYVQKRGRDARVAKRRHEDVDRRPVWCWVVSAGVPKKLLETLAFHSAFELEHGVYVLRGDLQQLGVNLGLVVASELPCTRTTLLLRLMAGGPRLPAAVSELAALPRDAYERTIAGPVLLKFQHRLQKAKRRLAPEEQEFIMVMHKSWDDAHAEGRAEGRAEMLRRLLVLKFGDLPTAVDQRLAAAAPEEIDRLLERILFADSLDALFA